MKSTHLINSLPVVKSTFQFAMTKLKVPNRNFVSETHGVTSEQLAEAKAQVTNSTREIVDNVVTHVNKANHIFDDRTVALNQRVTALEKQMTENTLKRAEFTDAAAVIEETVEFNRRRIIDLEGSAESMHDRNLIHTFTTLVTAGVTAFLGFKNFQLSKQVAQLENQNKNAADDASDAKPKSWPSSKSFG